MIREQYLAALYNGPLVPADALVVLSGDGTVRYDAAVGLLRQRIAHWVVLSGGVDDPPHSLDAEAARDYMVAKGLAEHRIVMDNASTNTHEQAEAIVRLIREHEWQTVILVASSYHLPRAFLTVLASLGDLRTDIAVVPFAAYANWGKAPPGREATRLDLLHDEFDKIERYGDHVASYEDGLAYLRDLEDDAG